MSIFLELLRCFLCCEDEHDYDYQTSHENSFPESHPYNQLPLEPIFHGHDLDDENFPYKNFAGQTLINSI